MTAVLAPPVFQPPRHFDNGAEWLQSLGSVPMERIVFDPWPGTATVAIYHAPGAPTRVLDESGQLDGEQVVPGFSLPVANVFRSVPPAGHEPG